MIGRMAHPIAPTTVKEIPAGLPATLRPLGALPAEEAQDRFWNLVALTATVLIALAVAGVWAYTQVRDSLKDIRSAGLGTLLEAEVGAMTIWIEEKKRDAERWASTPRVQSSARALVQLAARGSSPVALCAAPARHALMAEIAPYVVLEETVAVNLMLPDGTIISSNHDAYCGRHVASKSFLERLAPVFTQRRTVFIRPFTEEERVGDARTLPIARPLVWVETPVLDEGGAVVAAMGFARYAEQRFGKLLALSEARTTREAFAFDRRGFMLTESRYVGDLRAAGLLGPADSSILRLQIRDPGGNIIEGFRPKAPVEKWPLTRLMEAAIAGSEAGAILEPYRDYRGAEVIGAWRWFVEKEMGIAVEIEAQEAFAPLQYLQTAFGGLFAFVLVAIAAASASSLWAMRLRLREARRMGQYTIEREIGEGGMSRVYLARHTHLKRPTAVKVLKPAIATDEVVTRFEREVQLCSQLTHPNTIEIYDYGRTRDGRFYYAMEYLRGVSLEELVRNRGPLPLARAVHALRQVCGSLKEAHQRGLVHRDVKPQNLMLCLRSAQYDVLKVLDFGLVKEMHNPHTRDITQFAKVLGTPLYMAPERLRNPADADARADIYALAAVAYFIITGRHVFQAETDHDLVHQILNDPAPTLSQGGVRDAPTELEELLARCLAKDREQRPATIDAVLAVLTALARDYPWTEAEARAWWEEHGDAIAPDRAALGTKT